MNADAGEDARVAALRGYGLLDTPNEPAFDRIVVDTKIALDMPIVLISLVDADRQWFKAKVGLEAFETPRCISFCTHALQGREVFIVPDARQDERFATNPLVTGEPFIRFYAGAPLTTSTGQRIGTLCVIDTRPRYSFSAEQSARLSGFAAQTMEEVERRSARLKQTQRAA